VAVVASAGRLLCSLHKRTTVHFFRHEGHRKRQAFWTLSNDLSINYPCTTSTSLYFFRSTDTDNSPTYIITTDHGDSIFKYFRRLMHTSRLINVHKY
jgi:hypothetical protein